MKSKIFNKIYKEMKPYLTVEQNDKLLNVLQKVFDDIQIIKIDTTLLEDTIYDNEYLLENFLSSKEIEGCSQRTIIYYKSTLEKMLEKVDKKIEHITTDDLRSYLAYNKHERNSSKTTLDNIRRIMSSFFSWLEDEDYILKNPVRRIHRVKKGRIVKDIITDENLEHLRDVCTEIRDLALIELLISTGIRVGELVNLNINDIDFEERECIVFGKGESERKVYFDARTKIHLQKYIKTRKDDNPSLFVSLKKPYQSLSINGVENRLRKIGDDANIKNIHPHKFRRTMATRAIDKGMPIEQVQKLLGHVQIDTTMQYAMVNQNNVKISHRKYIS